MNISLELAVIIALLAIAAGAAGAFQLARAEHRRQEQDRRIGDLEKQVGDLEAERQLRNQTLVDAQGRRRGHHAYNTLAAIEDATSLLLDASLDIEALKARQETTLSILNVLREGPGAYNPEKKNGKGESK